MAAEKDDLLLLDPSLDSADIVRIRVGLTYGSEQYRQFFHSASNLSKKSEVFRAMLNSSLDCQERCEGIIWIRDFLPRTVHQFLNFLNGNELYVCLTEDLIDLVRMADKYFVEELKEMVEELLIKRFDSISVLNIYQSIHLHDAPELKVECETFISLFFSSFAMSYNFLYLDEQTVKSVLSLNSLNVETEMEVYHAAYRWSRERCIENRFCICESHMIQVGKKLFECVRYGNLTEEEKKDVFASFLEGETALCIRSRQAPDSSIFFQYLDKIHSLYVESCKSSVMTFIPNEYTKCLGFVSLSESIYLIGFRGRFNCSPRVTHKFNLQLCCNDTVVCQQDDVYTEIGSKIMSNGNAYWIDYVLKNPLKLKMDRYYMVSVCYLDEQKDSPVYSTSCEGIPTVEDFKICGNATHICQIYYNPLTYQK